MLAHTRTRVHMRVRHERGERRGGEEKRGAGGVDATHAHAARGTRHAARRGHEGGTRQCSSGHEACQVWRGRGLEFQDG